MIRDVAQSMRDGFWRGVRRERVIRDYQRLMSDPHRFTYAQRADIFERMGEFALTEENRERWRSNAEMARRQAEKYDPPPEVQVK